MTSVSVITPTYARPGFLSLARQCFLSQDHPDIEWLVLDDSEQPHPEFRDGTAPNIRYIHSPTRLSVGHKRNLLVEQARGDVIVHFDDDDCYAPQYVSRMLQALEGTGADFLNLRGFFLFHAPSRRFAFWDLNIKLGLHFDMAPAGGLRLLELTPQNNRNLLDNHFGYGFGYIYRRRVWESVRFPDISLAEDGPFAMLASTRFKVDGVLDPGGLALHVIHNGNSSRCYPQYVLPNHLVLNMFGAERLRPYMSG